MWTEHCEYCLQIDLKKKPFFSSTPCVCVCVHSLTHMHVHTCLCVYTGLYKCEYRVQRLTLGVFLDCSLLYGLRQGPSLSLELTSSARLTGQSDLMIHPSPQHTRWSYTCIPSLSPAFSTGAGESNSSLHADVALCLLNYLPSLTNLV